MKENDNPTPEQAQAGPEMEPTQPETSEQAPSATDNPEADALRKELEEARNKYIYLLSDFENFKRNAARERMDLLQTAGREIMVALLPVLDDFDRAAKSAPLSEGMALIHNKLVHTLKHKGLVNIGATAGDEFNPDMHEALVEIPAPAEEMKGKIVDVVDPGYQLGERIIRFAKVVVGR